MAKAKITKTIATKSGLSGMDKFLESAGWFAFIALGLITVFTYFRVPDVIPVHFNVIGHADRYGNKAMLFAVFAVAAFIFIGITFMRKVCFQSGKRYCCARQKFWFCHPDCQVSEAYCHAGLYLYPCHYQPGCGRIKQGTWLFIFAAFHDITPFSHCFFL